MRHERPNLHPIVHHQQPMGMFNQPMGFNQQQQQQMQTPAMMPQLGHQPFMGQPVNPFGMGLNQPVTNPMIHDYMRPLNVVNPAQMQQGVGVGVGAGGPLMPTSLSPSLNALVAQQQHIMSKDEFYKYQESLRLRQQTQKQSSSDRYRGDRSDRYRDRPHRDTNYRRDNYSRSRSRSRSRYTSTNLLYLIFLTL
jgi:hypothetical protein